MSMASVKSELCSLIRSSTAKVGTAIEYKGNDYLAIDLSTRLIYNATSSSDLLNFYIQLGDDVIAVRS